MPETLSLFVSRAPGVAGAPWGDWGGIYEQVYLARISRGAVLLYSYIKAVSSFDFHSLASQISIGIAHDAER